MISTLLLQMFQSSPAPKGGRYFRSCRYWRWGFQCFNPRPPRRAGATPPPEPPPSLTLVSILARPEGRALRDASVMGISCFKFQSSPAPKGGRYHLSCGGFAVEHDVSILARPEGRALRVCARPRARAILFQSSPAPKGGRYQRPGRSPLCQKVSILARPEGRALPYG